MGTAKIDVEYVARLARLALDDKEKAAYARQLESILTHMDKLNELDTGGVDATAHIIPKGTPVRADEVRPSLSGKELLGNAPSTEGGSFRVPKVISV